MLKGFHMLRKKILFEIIIIKSFKGIEIKCFNFEGTVYNKIKASDSIYKMIILLKIFSYIMLLLFGWFNQNKY